MKTGAGSSVHPVSLGSLLRAALLAATAVALSPIAVDAQQDPGGIGAPGADEGVEGDVNEGAEEDVDEGDIIEPGSRFDRNERIDISPGDIPALDFLRFLSDFTGLPVLIDTRQAGSLQEITVANNITAADDELVKTLLAANGITVREQVLDNGRTVLRVSAAGATPAQQSGQPEKLKVVVPGSDGSPELVPDAFDDSDIGVRPDELATMVFVLKHREPGEIKTSLEAILSGGGGTAAGGRRGTGFNIVEVEESQNLIVTAKFSFLNYFQKLIAIFDVPFDHPERIVQIVDIEYAYVSDLLSVIEEFIGTGTGARRGRSRTRTGTATTGTRTQGAAGAARAAARARSTQDGFETVLIPDERTNKLIVETYGEQDLEDINMLVRELDIRFEARRLRTHIYQVRYLKADEVAQDLSALIGGGGVGLSGQRGLGSRQTRGRGIARRGQTQTQTGRTAGTPQASGPPSGQSGPALIVPHIQTNSLLIQAEPADYAEVINILNQIDTKRRQVFLEAALVQVTANSALNYTIELLAGEPDNRATRVLLESSFGLSQIDFENFDRIISDPTALPAGGIAAIQHRGKFPALIHFFKSNQDSQVLATPFILADDNMPNLIEIKETQFVQNTSTGQSGVTSTSQEAEEAGVTLEITPTISSEEAVFLELSLEVSEFAGQAATPQLLPPKLSNTITSAVTIPDGDLFVIGGLTRENNSKIISKVPILGDIPLLGKLFRSEANSTGLSNLYIFLRAHVLTHPDFDDHAELTQQAVERVRVFAEDLQITDFEQPSVEDPPPPPFDPRQPQEFDLRGPEASTRSGRYDPNRERVRYSNDPESPFAPPQPRRPLETPTLPPPPPRESEVETPTVQRDPEPETPQRDPSRDKKLRQVLEGSGATVDEEGKSWLVPLKPE